MKNNEPFTAFLSVAMGLTLMTSLGISGALAQPSSVGLTGDAIW